MQQRSLDVNRKPLEFPSYVVAQRYLEHASPESVHNFLREAPKSFHPDHCDEKYESAISSLLKRTEPIIHLAIAQFSTSRTALQSLFESGELHLRHAIASNRRCFSDTFCWYSEWKGFLINEALSEILGSEDRELVSLFFTNPNLSWRLLETLVLRKGVYQTLSQERWERALYFGLRNPAIYCDPLEDSLDDPFPEDRRTRMEIWNLLVTFEYSINHASILNEPIFGIKDFSIPKGMEADRFFVEMIEKWGAREHLVDGISAHATRASKNLHEYLSQHPNKYVRAGFFRGKQFSNPEEVERLIEIEGEHFLWAAIRNDSLYERNPASVLLRNKTYGVIEKCWNDRSMELHLKHPSRYPAPDDAFWTNMVTC